MLNSKFDLYKTEWLDLVFTDRNKNYGAYDLRAHYGDNMMKALAITMTAFTVAAISLTIVFKHDIVPADPIINTIPDIPIAPPKIEKPVEAKLKPEVTKPIIKTPNKPAAAPISNVQMQRDLPPVVTPDHLAPADPPRIDPGIATGPVDAKGDGRPSVNAVDASGTGGKGYIPAGTGDNVIDPSKGGGLDVMPEPFGGAGAWSKFLQRNLHYPDTEQEGRVIISFIVEKDGHLTDLKIVKGVVSELDREALRVLKIAPAWKPGLQNGQPVRVKYTIPIVFVLNQ